VIYTLKKVDFAEFTPFLRGDFMVSPDNNFVGCVHVEAQLIHPTQTNDHITGFVRWFVGFIYMTGPFHTLVAVELRKGKGKLGLPLSLKGTTHCMEALALILVRTCPVFVDIRFQNNGSGGTSVY
jgi:hypothetical protein